ncbi:MAG: type II secretion system F family protein [Opitutaceae bacterium]|jgi:type II secretory pathway component PulF
MAQFSYKGVQRDGALAEGLLDAGSRGEAMRQVEALGLKPIRITEAANGAAARRSPGAGLSGAAPSGAAGSPASDGARDGRDLPFWKMSLGGKRKITPRILENFTRLLSSLLAAGVPFSRALVILYREATVPVAKEQWKEIHDLVIDGMSLSDAMARSPQTFPKVYVAMVEAGETGGFLDVVLAQIADFQARERDIKSKVVSALTYPIVLLILAIGVLIFLMVFFIPRFQLIFKSFNAELPLLTQMIVATSQAVRDWGIYVGGIILVTVLSLRTWFKSEAGRRTWEGLILRTPLVGPLLAQFAMARFTRMLGTLLGAGVPLINALNVAQRSIGNQILIDAVTVSIDQVKEGKALAASLAPNRSLFPSAVIEMISVAEESGKLDVELLRIANVTEGDLERELKTAVSLAEPVMLFLIAAFIGTIFIGMVYPIFSLTDHIQ